MRGQEEQPRKQMRLLIVDDDTLVIDCVTFVFEDIGYLVFSAVDGMDALKKISACQPDIILLDFQMPQMDGISVCKRIREHITCPILFITAFADDERKLLIYEAGADEIIEKPVNYEVLKAQVKAHLRREERKRRQIISVRFFGMLAINYTDRILKIGDGEIFFSKKEFDIIELLSINEGQVFDRERIYETIWGFDGEGSSDTVTEHISNIRTKLKKHTPYDYIETAWGIGYKWVK